MQHYVLLIALLGAEFLALAGLLNGNGPRVAWALSTVCFAVAFVLAFVGAVHE
jgi:hypothetical protein